MQGSLPPSYIIKAAATVSAYAVCVSSSCYCFLRSRYAAGYTAACNSRRLCIFSKTRHCIALLTKKFKLHPGISAATVFGAILFNPGVGLTQFFV